MVELGKSKLPLEEDLIKKKIEFIKTWSEWASQNEERAIANSFLVNNNTKTIFTVPKGKTLFITSAYLAIENHGATSTARTAVLVEAASFNEILSITAAGTSSNAHSLNFTHPIKIEEEEIIQLVPDSGFASARAVAGFRGFLIAKRIS